jgi:type IV secretory pathway VirB3-like protein
MSLLCEVLEVCTRAGMQVGKYGTACVKNVLFIIFLYGFLRGVCSSGAVSPFHRVLRSVRFSDPMGARRGTVSGKTNGTG